MTTINIPSENYYCNLGSLSAIHLVGEQTDSYLQGQVSVNMELLSDTNALLACHCDFKGKMWNANYILRYAGGVDFLAKKSALNACINELKKYGVFSKVDIEDVSADREFIGLGGVDGDDIKTLLSKHFEGISEQHRSVVSNELGWVLTLNSSNAIRFICSFPKDSPALHELREQITEYPESFWDALDIVDGIGPIVDATSNEFVPQMFNMQALDAIDFNKGCYMGQEVVARTKYLGKNKRAAYILKSNSARDSNSTLPASGDILEKAVGENWRRGGTIVHVSHFDGVLYVLAVLSNDSEAGEQLRVKQQPDLILTIDDLPYIVNEKPEIK